MKEKRDRPVYKMAGAMSGTSMDGVDIAVIETDGVEITGFGPVSYRPYETAERAVIRAGLGHWPGSPETEAAAQVVEAAHLRAMEGVEGVAALGFHGQTLAHDPDHARTHQAGDGDRLAMALGLPVVWDFRSADMQLGGQGAPLAPFYHWALARWIGANAPTAFLNLGGVGNITWVDPTAPAPDHPGALVAFDTGPANAPLDDLMRARGQGSYDREGALTAKGRPDPARVETFLRDGYFLKRPPKSLDRDAFPRLLPAMAGLGDADALATLAECCARAVARGAQDLPAMPARVLVTGGGRHNAGIMRALTKALPCPVAPVESAGLDGDALEAQAFAYLALRVALGLTTSAPGTTGVPAAVGGGRISGGLRL